MTPELLASQWLELFDAKVTKPHNQKGFMEKHDELMKALGKLDLEDQAIFARLINKGVNQSLRKASDD